MITAGPLNAGWMMAAGAQRTSAALPFPTLAVRDIRQLCYVLGVPVGYLSTDADGRDTFMGMSIVEDLTLPLGVFAVLDGAA